MLFAAILYLVGVVVILLLRPALMFDNKGQWKEFGTISTDHTIFPLWLFCILWAALSYCITLIFIHEPVHRSTLISGLATAAATLRETEPPEDLVHPLSPKRKGKGAKATETTAAQQETTKSGYYMLDSKELKKTGVPKYIYVGDDKSQPIPVGREDSDGE